MQKNKILIGFLLGIFLISMVQASLVFEQSTSVDVKIVCLNNGYCSSAAVCNVSVFNPSDLVLLNNTQTTQDPSLAFYTFNLNQNHTSALGTYQVGGFCKDGTISKPIDFTFDITPTGEPTGSTGFFFILYLVLFAIIIFGFAVKSEWVAILGGLGLIFMGIFTFNSGIVIFRNVATQVVSLITIGFGAIIAVVTGMELIENNL